MQHETVCKGRKFPGELTEWQEKYGMGIAEYGKYAGVLSNFCPK
jgi:hypothetical protein